MKSLMLFLRCVLDDLGTRCGTSTTADYKKICSRVEHEGLSFITITLSNFGKDFEKSLDQGYLDDDQFGGFHRRGGLPVFLRGFLRLVFDEVSGRLLDTPNIDAIFSIRQLTLMFSKINLPCSKERVDRAFTKYVECEQIVRKHDALRTSEDIERFLRIKRLVFNPMLADVDRKIYEGEILGKHGPGSTADRLLGNKKYLLPTWTDRLERIFPYGEYASASWLQYFEEPPIYLEPGSEVPVKVTAVPKNLKTPRLIAQEPTCMQYMQQGIFEAMVCAIREDNLSQSLVGFDDQTPNQRLALEGSITGNLATLDLSDASDRVSNQLVRLLCVDFSHLSEAVDATRSRKADVLGHGVIRLAKFASMGSALCFPFEALTFMVIVLMGLEDELNRPLTRKDVKSLLGSVRTYGDDIIVPVSIVRSVVNRLEGFGLKVNVDKSFWTGKFRESCGKDYYDGHDVSVVKMRSMIPTQRRHVTEIVSTVSLRNQLFDRGFTSSVSFLDEKIESLIPFPYVESTSRVLGRIGPFGFTAERTDRNLHYPLVKGAAISAELPSSTLDGYPALLKFYLKRGLNPIADSRHLERAGRPKTVRIKVRWLRPY